jgi:hypothetical protein
MITALLLAATVATAPQAEPPRAPTPEEIYAGAKSPWGLIVTAHKVKQEFTSQDDGTYLGVVKPTFEQQQQVPVWAKEHIENIVGTWEDVARRLGSIRNAEGNLVSIEKAFQIAEGDRSTYLVVESMERATTPGDKRCAAALIGVSLGRTTTDESEHLVSRPYGAVYGCGIVKQMLSIAKPDFSNTTDPAYAWQMANSHLLDAMAKELGIKLYRNTIKLTPEQLKGGGTEP